MRDVHREAWFLYTVTSLEWFEQAAQACDDFADTFNRILTGQSAHGLARLDYWVQAYVNHAQKIRQRTDLVRHGGEGGAYRSLYGALNQSTSDAKGMREQPLFGWMTTQQKETWEAAFDRIRAFCGLATQALRMNNYAGYNWLEYQRDPNSVDKTLLDRDDGYIGTKLEGTLSRFQQKGTLPIPDQEPAYTLDYQRTCKAGDTCPWTGVWIPEQGLANYGLAFCVAGVPIQPAFEIVDENWGADGMKWPVTEARDTTWHAVVPQQQPQPQSGERRRHNVAAGQPCPETGCWFTPARPKSRQYFKAGDVFPGPERTDYPIRQDRCRIKLLSSLTICRPVRIQCH